MWPKTPVGTFVYRLAGMGGTQVSRHGATIRKVFTYLSGLDALPSIQAGLIIL